MCEISSDIYDKLCYYIKEKNMGTIVKKTIINEVLFCWRCDLIVSLAALGLFMLCSSLHHAPFKV